ncbi:signal transduction histidine kinase [Rhodoblastus acidophilus]|uniref:sensor histidine kinase n=1 Tax=Rhodoblastus acidophilus TaxID=1074 RepID=UPI002224287F|nr:ATP-binding protein [Rhodoblastus acidophilus]MCW2285136.1 signal transduction histidine kinase [Rhodoblastus acidophilus]MCW2334006.1 signal transduction histidine kinase [Rhodoblastus acidophilus]
MTQAPSLMALVVRRIAFFAGLAMLAQLAGVFSKTSSDTQNLGRLAIEMETRALAKGVASTDGPLAYSLPPDRRARYQDAANGYLVRVRTVKSGALLYANCECKTHFLPMDVKPVSFWMQEIKPGRPLHVAGGRIVETGSEPVMVEIAILGDPDGVTEEVLAHEVFEHMALPMSLMLIFVLGATIFSIAQALRPVARASDQVARLDPLKSPERLPSAAMPREIARFTQAVNASFDRVVELMRSQKLLTSAISHEVRTPLAVAQLELEKIPDPRARKVEQDLGDLNHLVEQFTDLARLEGAALSAKETIHPARLAEQVVGDLAGLVYANGKSIEFVDAGAEIFEGHKALVENALRNLIENAARHAPDGATIRVEAGPGATFSVLDDGRTPPAPETSRPGLGLKIVRRIAEIHDGRFAWTHVPEMGVAARLDFAQARRTNS